MIEYSESTRRMILKGTIIDFETIGEINFSVPSFEKEYYRDLRPTIFGYLIDDMLIQYCAENEHEISELIKIMKDSIPRLDEPYFALNAKFERNLCEDHCELSLIFIDVRGQVRGSKWGLRRDYGIPTYGDPFDGDGKRCMEGWIQGDFDNCLLHNRACLQIERDLLERIRGLHARSPNSHPH